MAVAANTYNWIKTWGLQPEASNTNVGQTINQQLFTISEASSDYSAYGLMSVKKQVKKTTTSSETSYWWGYST